MTFSIDKWHTKGLRFDIREYNCWHFLRDAWIDATGQDLGNRVPNAVRDYRARFEHGASVEHTRIATPESPCIAYFPKARKATPHIGMYVNGKVLHLDRDGTRYERVEVMTQRLGPVEYYK